MAVNKFGSLNTVVQCAGIAPPSKVVGRKGAHSLEMFQKVCGLASFSAPHCPRCM